MMIRASVAILLFVSLGFTRATSQPAPLDPKILAFKLPADIKWSGTETSANRQAVVAGDPTKEGLYVVLNKWNPGNMSRPHSHPNDRFITVIKGTWWVGTGNKYDPASTTPMPEGSVVTHFGKQVHYDGAKDGEVILQIVGMGPATATPAPQGGQH